MKRARWIYVLTKMHVSEIDKRAFFFCKQMEKIPSRASNMAVFRDSAAFEISL